MKIKTILTFFAVAAISMTASAITRQPEHCGPKTPTPKDPPVVSKPEPKAPREARESGSRDQKDLCSRWPTMWICTLPTAK